MEVWRGYGGTIILCMCWRMTEIMSFGSDPTYLSSLLGTALLSRKSGHTHGDTSVDASR